jgi:shikimate dehydrogenase
MSSNAQSPSTVGMQIGPQTRFIISTSGRLTSLLRYQKLLQEVLRLDLAYLPISPQPGENAIQPAAFAGVLRGLPCLGGAISKDIKFKIIPFLDRLDASAQQVTSVNTVLCSQGALIGYNTDAYGFEQAIRQGIANCGKKITRAVVYGYGGVFGVACRVLQSLGIEVSVTGRDAQAVARCTQEFGLRPFEGTAAQLFVNAAPVSDTSLEQAPGFLAALKGCVLVFDHHMPGGALLEYCRQNGIAHIPGTAMYYPQMYRQWELFLSALPESQLRVSDLPSLIARAEGLANAA